jgi:hypothetical protein
MFFGDKKKLEDKINSTLYDLTHLEINTIIKDEMTATKAPNSPRLILNSLASTYYTKLIQLGEKYEEFLGPPAKGTNNLFRGMEVHLGSGYESFHELGDRANTAVKLIKANKDKVQLPENEMDSDIMMLKRIETISNDVRCILKMVDTAKVEPVGERAIYEFDGKDRVNDFRNMRSQEAEKLELNLDLRQLMVLKKANDIGTEKVVLQTVIGMDGDVTTRISKSLADHPIPVINNMHHEAIGISVDFWKTLINVVVELGKSFMGLFTTNKDTKA